MQRKRNSQAAIAYEFIRDQIISYALPPETAISDNKFAKELDMSRAPIREAILLLQMDGLIQTNGEGKMVVAPIGIDDIVDILHVRCALETEAVLLIAQRGWLDPEQERELTRIHKKMTDCANPRSFSEHYKYDDLFHSALTAFAGSARICEILERMRLQMQRARWLNVAIPERQLSATEEHGRLLDSILTHDRDRAADLLRTHFQNSEEAFQTVLRNKQIQSLATMINGFYGSADRP